MDQRDRTITVYTAQTPVVLDIIRDTGCYQVKLSYIAAKYDIVKDIFLQAYRWYAVHAAQFAARPDTSESAVWTFLDPGYVEHHPESVVFKLSVPVEEAVFFRMSDWNKILNMRYIGADPQQEQLFAKKLEQQGIDDSADVLMKPYYPQLKQQLMASWQNLFRYDREMKESLTAPYPDMQAGIWQIKKEWLKEVII